MAQISGSLFCYEENYQNPSYLLSSNRKIVIVCVCDLIDFLQGQQSSLCCPYTFHILSKPSQPHIRYLVELGRIALPSNIVPLYGLYSNSL